MKKLIVLVLCGLLFCLLLSGCKERQKEMSSTYWEAVNVAPFRISQIPPTTWRSRIEDGENMVDVDQEVTEKIGELLKNHPGYHVASSKINLKIEVTLAPERENERKD